MNADPRVMEFFPAVLSGAESSAALEVILAHFERCRFGLWLSFEAQLIPCVEIAWRLVWDYWGWDY